MASIYIKNAAILTAASLVLRAAGMLLRILLAAHLGGEGMGLYQLIFTAYGVSIAAATGGLSVAATRLSVEALAGGDSHAVKKLLQRLILAGVVLGLLAGEAQYTLAGAIARWLLGDVRAAAALRVLSFSLPFMAVGAAIRGYFMADRNVRPNVLAQLIEQSVRIGLIIWLLQRLPTQDLALSTALVTIGNTVSEAVSCLLMLYFLSGRKNTLRASKSTAAKGVPGWWKMAEIFWPVEGSRLTSSLLRTAETSLVPVCLAMYAGSRSTALSQFGALRGMAMPLLTFPFSFLGTLSGLLMPEIARAKAAHNHKKLRELANRTMSVTWGISLFAGLFFTLWAGPLGQLVYRDVSVGKYLFWLGPFVPFMYLESMVDGIMKGIGEQLASFRYELLNFALRLAGILLLLPRCGIAGYAAIIAVSNLFTCALNFRRMLAVLQMRFCWGGWVVKPGMFLLVSLLVCMGVQGSTAGFAEPLRFFAAAGAMALCYGALLWCFSLRRIFVKTTHKENGCSKQGSICYNKAK